MSFIGMRRSVNRGYCRGMTREDGVNWTESGEVSWEHEASPTFLLTIGNMAKVVSRNEVTARAPYPLKLVASFRGILSY
jgi:hypothetical protein